MPGSSCILHMSCFPGCRQTKETVIVIDFFLVRFHTIQLCHESQILYHWWQKVTCLVVTIILCCVVIWSVSGLSYVCSTMINHAHLQSGNHSLVKITYSIEEIILVIVLPFVSPTPSPAPSLSCFPCLCTCIYAVFGSRVHQTSEDDG